MGCYLLPMSVDHHSLWFSSACSFQILLMGVLTNQQVVKDNLLSYYHRKLITFNGLTRPCLLSMGLGGSRSYVGVLPSQFRNSFRRLNCSHLQTTKSFGNARSDYLDEVYCSTNLLTVSKYALVFGI